MKQYMGFQTSQRKVRQQTAKGREEQQEREEGWSGKVHVHGDNTICKRGLWGFAKNFQKTWDCNISEAAQDLEAAPGAPKDKPSAQDSVGVVYSIPCNTCPKVYIGETGWMYGMREKEHMKDVKQVDGVNYTKAKKWESQSITSLCWQIMRQSL